MTPKFQYVAKNKAGDRIEGKIEADNSETVVKQLKERGYFVTSLKKKKEKNDVMEFFKLNKRVTISDLAIFSQQFSVMINAGVSLVESLEIMSRQIDHPRLREVVIKIQEDVETGASLAEAMSEFPDVFPNLYVQLIKAGEAGGVLDKVLIKLKNHYERQNELNKKIRSSMYYPAAILLVAVSVIIFLVTNVVPTFVDMFSGFGAELPLPTRMLMGFSSFMQNYWWAIIIFFVALFYIGVRYYRTAPGKKAIDRLILKIPAFGKMFKKVYISRLTSTLAILMDSGVDLLSSLSIVESVVNNKVYANSLVEARARVREGENLSKTLDDKEELYPKMIVQMISVGEESGSIDEMLHKISDFYDKDVESTIEGTVSLIEPALIVMMAVVIGFVAISIVLPMFDMFSYI